MSVQYRIDANIKKIGGIRNRPEVANNLADNSLCVCAAAAQHVGSKEQRPAKCS